MKIFKHEIDPVLKLRRIYWDDRKTLHTPMVALDFNTVVRVQEYDYKNIFPEEHGPLVWVDTNEVRGQIFIGSFDKITKHWERVRNTRQYLYREQTLN